MRAHAKILLVCIIGLSLAALSTATAPAATSSTVVGATVPSATSLDASGCLPGVPGVTDFGVVTAGTSTVTPADCIMQFGSSNDSSSLRIAQRDGRGVGMWRAPHGPLDPGFGAAGEATLSETVVDVAKAGALAPDGSILFAGYTVPLPTIDFDGLLGRLDPLGAPDNGFAGDGTVTFNSATNDYLNGVDVLADGTVLAVGIASDVVDSIELMRRMPNGLPDPVLDGDGERRYDIGPGTDRGIDLVADTDGAWLLAAVADGAGDWQHGVLRVDATGAFDNSFSGNGWTVHRAVGSADDFPSSIAIDAAGRPLIGGYTVPAGTTRPQLVRLEPDGDPDPTFGGDGDVLLPIGNSGSVNAVVPRADGTILFAANVDFGSGSRFVVGRALDDGTLDPAFGSGAGYVSPPVGSGASVAKDLVELPDGRIAAVGEGIGSGTDMAVVLLQEDGGLDPDLDGDGVSLYDIAGGTDSADAVGLDADGRIVAIGQGAVGGIADVAVIRLDVTEVADYAPGNDWSTPSAGLFGACLRAVGAGTTATWSPDASCDAIDGAYWNAVPATLGSAGSAIATGNVAVDTATASLRFGFRTLDAQRAGRYIAPITFEVVAPAA